MKRLIDAIINKWFCAHEDGNYLTQTKVYGDESKLPIKIVRTYRCKKCGRYKRIKF